MTETFHPFPYCLALKFVIMYFNLNFCEACESHNSLCNSLFSQDRETTSPFQPSRSLRSPPVHAPVSERKKVNKELENE